MAGILTVVLLFLIVPRELSQVSSSGRDLLNGGELALLMTVYAAFVGFVYIVLPGLLLLFYSGRNVRRTFESRDPRARWTGKCPLSVLTASQFLAGGGVTLAILLIYVGEVPWFGRSITGISARLILIAATILSGYLAWATYKLKPHSWWVSLCFSVLSLVWFAGSRSQLGLAADFTGRGISLQLDEKTMSAVVVLFGLAWVIFLIFIKKHFSPSAERDDGIRQFREPK